MQLTLTGWTFWRWVVLCLLAAIATLFLWWAGPLLRVGGIAPLSGVEPRVLASIIIALVAALVALNWRFQRASPASDGEFARSRAAATYVEAPAASKAQKEAMERGFQLALGVLRRICSPGLLNRSYRYELPWYAVIGAEKSGKTALLRASGLRFPLNEARKGKITAGAASLSFTDEAVLVETRGPLVAPGEENTFGLFANLLKRHRPSQPLNGLILVLSLPDLVNAGDAERFSFHTDLKDQLERFQSTLKVRLPVYVVLTKTDAVPGFDEFCADLTAAERQAVFGVTLPLYDEKGMTTKGKPLPATFSAEFDQFLQWQMPRMLSQVSQSFGVGGRFDCFMLLPYLATVKPLIADLIEDVFKPNTFERPLLLRGFYFVSTYSAIPRNGEAGSSAAPGSALEAGEARRSGLFIHDLLTRVIFEEAGLVEHDPASRRRKRLLRGAAITTGLSLAALLVTWWTLSFIGNSYLISDLNRATERASTAVEELEENPALQQSSEADLAAVVPVLNALKNLPTGWAQRNDRVPLRLEGGLSKTPGLAVATRREYVDGLATLLLPRIVNALQKEIVANLGNPDALYGLLKVYLILGRAAPMDQAAVLDWGRHLLSGTYPGPAHQPLRTTLLAHLSALLESGTLPVELDPGLLKQARSALNEYAPAKRGMAILQELPEIKALPAWRLTDITGPLAPYSLTRRSGRSLSEPIQGMYTANAFFTVVLPALSRVAAMVVSEDWVRFPTTPARPESVRTAQLALDMTDLYVNDYIATWQNLISDVTLSGFDSLRAELTILQAVLGPPSPLSAYLLAVKQQTTLELPEAPADASKLVSVMTAALQPEQARLKALGQAVTSHFADLHAFTSGSPSPLDEVLKSMALLRATIGPAASVGAGDPTQIAELTAGPAFAQILGQLRLSTLSAPPALVDSILALVRQTSSIANAGVRADIDSAWKTQVFPFCQAAINGKYPFSSSSTDVTLADFARVFGPEGLLDKFFERQLKPFVDTLSSPWRPLANAGARPDITPAALATFEQAARIRSIFFADGATPQIAFAITPVSLDPGALRVRLTIDGQDLVYQYGPTLPVTMKWPGAVGGARIEFGAGGEGVPSSISYSGPWALFRFLGARTLSRQGPTQFGFSATLGPHSASFALAAASVNNPFQKSPFSGFRCPPSLVQ